MGWDERVACKEPHKRPDAAIGEAGFPADPQERHLKAQHRVRPRGAGILVLFAVRLKAIESALKPLYNATVRNFHIMACVNRFALYFGLNEYAKLKGFDEVEAGDVTFD